MEHTLARNEFLASRRAISRRDFVHGFGLVVMSGLLLSTGVDRLGPTLATTQVVPPTIMRTTFAPYVGDTFYVRLGPADLVPLQLVNVRDLLSARALASRGFTVDPDQSFSIRFRGPADRPLPQDIYRFEHSRVGGFDLFIVPMRPEQDGRYYEAIFNRLREHPSH